MKLPRILLAWLLACTAAIVPVTVVFWPVWPGEPKAELPGGPAPAGFFESGPSVVAVQRQDHPALRMWGPGNEVLLAGLPSLDLEAFGEFYLQPADMFHALVPDHPVIYRESDPFILQAVDAFMEASPQERPCLLYGMNIYSLDLERMLAGWPGHGLDRPLFVTEFGGEPEWEGSRARGYLSMWRTIRAYPEYVMGGVPYVWTTEGPEPTDIKWGLIDGDASPVDDTFGLLKSEWLKETGAQRTCP